MDGPFLAVPVDSGTGKFCGGKASVTHVRRSGVGLDTFHVSDEAELAVRNAALQHSMAVTSSILQDGI